MQTKKTSMSEKEKKKKQKKKEREKEREAIRPTQKKKKKKKIQYIYILFLITKARRKTGWEHKRQECKTTLPFQRDVRLLIKKHTIGTKK